MGRREILSEGGAVTVELFLVIPLVIVLLVAGLQIVAAARVKIELQGAVREGARVAATTPDPSRSVDAVLAALDPEMAEGVRVSVTRPSVPGQIATVSATYSHVIDLLLLPDLTFGISARAAMRTER